MGLNFGLIVWAASSQLWPDGAADIIVGLTLG